MAIRFPTFIGQMQGTPAEKKAARESRKGLSHLQRRLAAENTIRMIKQKHPKLKAWQRPMNEIRGRVQDPVKGGKWYKTYRKELKRIRTAQKRGKSVATRFKKIT